MEGVTIQRIDEIPAIHGGAVKLAADALGVESFGLQVLDLPADFDYPEHDHAADGQEEVYVVLDGEAELAVGGERVAAGTGTVVRVDPRTRRAIVPGPSGVRLLAIGCVPGGGYERPEDFRVRTQA